MVIYRFVTANTIDQRIVERAAAKRKLEKMVIHKGLYTMEYVIFMSFCKIENKESWNEINTKYYQTLGTYTSFVIDLQWIGQPSQIIPSSISWYTFSWW